MPIGIVSNEEFEDELKQYEKKGPISEDTTPQVEIVTEKQKGRNGATEVPDSLRQIIAEEALLNGRQAALGLARDFGISSSSVSAYTKGATSTKTYDTPSPSIVSHLSKTRTRAVRKASKTLNAALGSISQEKLDYADAKDLSVIAKNMSAIIKDLEPQTPPEDSSNRAPQFVIFAPQFRKEESFDIIDVKE